MKNSYYTWFYAKHDDEEEYSYLVPLYQGYNVLGAYVNHRLDTPIGVSKEFWSVEEVPEFGDSSFTYERKKPPIKDLIEAQRELIAGVFINA